MPVVIAWLEEMHAIVTVCAGVFKGNPDAREAFFENQEFD